MGYTRLSALLAPCAGAWPGKESSPVGNTHHGIPAAGGKIHPGREVFGVEHGVVLLLPMKAQWQNTMSVCGPCINPLQIVESWSNSVESFSLALAPLYTVQNSVGQHFLRVRRVPLRGNNAESITQRKLLNLRVTFFPGTAQRSRYNLFYNTSHTPSSPQPGVSMLYGVLCSALHMVLLEFGILGNKGFIVGILAGFRQCRSWVSWHQPSRIQE